MAMTIKKILVPIAFTDNCEVAKDTADEIAKRFQAEVKLFHVVETSPYEVYMQRGIMENVPLYERVGVSLPSSGSKFIIKDVLEETRNELNRIAKAKTTGIQYAMEVAQGYSVDEILRQIESYHPDLVVMATHGRTGMKHMVLGSVTEKVVRLARVPVLTVPMQ
ncbi:MAG: universal stress protein [Deltaproteobacteria bacterium]|nr:universal stress protein [Deltaproteobacteria bacterium]